MDIFAGPLCQGLNCAPISIYIFLTEILPRYLPTILGTILIFIGLAGLISHRRLKAPKPPILGIALLLAGVLLISGQQIVIWSKQRFLNNQLDNAVSRLNFSVYSSDDETEQKLQNRYINQAKSAETLYLSSNYPGFSLIQFNSEIMNRDFTNPTTKCGVLNPEYSYYFKKCEKIGMMSDGNEVYGDLAIQDYGVSKVFLRKNETTIVLSAYVSSTKELISILETLQVADPSTLSYSGHERFTNIR